MNKGGYQIIDLKSYNFNSENRGREYEDFEHITIDIAESRVKGIGKPIIVSGLVVDGKEYPDTICSVIRSYLDRSPFVKYGKDAYVTIKLPYETLIGDTIIISNNNVVTFN